MKIGASMWSVVSYFQRGEMDVMDFLRYAETIGIQGVELLDFFWKKEDEELPQVVDYIKGSSLAVSAYAISNDFVVDDKGKREAIADYIERSSEIAQKLGAEVIRVFSGNLKEGFSFDEARGWIVDGLRKGAAIAEKYDIVLALENHGLLAGKSSQIKGIIDEVGSRYLRATFDTGNFLLVDEKPKEAAKVLAPLTANVHLKDFKPVPEGTPHSYPSLSGGFFQGTAVGEGIVDLSSVLGELKSAGYSEYLSIEFEGIGDAKVGLEKSIENTKKILSEIG